MTNHQVTQSLNQIGGPISPAPLTALTSDPVAIVYGDADAYSNGGHYSAGTCQPVVLAAAYGQGRVLALGHEGYLSTDDYDDNGVVNLHDYGNPQFGLDVIHWLAKRSLNSPYR